MKTLSYSLLFLLFVSLHSCSKKGDEGASVKSPFTLKYELVGSSVLSATPNLPALFYTNSTGQGETVLVITAAKTWSKTLTVTSTQRPFMVNFEPLAIVSEGPGSVTANIYVNGKVVASSVTQVITPGGVVNILPLTYFVQ